MADINKEASWVTARLMEVSNATQDGTNLLITNANLNDFVPSDVVRTSSQTLTDAEKQQARTNIDAVSTSQLISSIEVLDEDISTLASEKMDKMPSEAVGGNIPIIAANRNIADSGKSIADIYDAAMITKTVSGDLVTIEDGADGVPIKSMTVQINPVQAGSGDPSPSNVRTISGWTKAVVRHGSSNLMQTKFYTGISYNAAVGTAFALTEDSSVVDVGGGVFTKEVGAWGGTNVLSQPLAAESYHVHIQIDAPNIRATLYVLDRTLVVKTKVTNYSSGTSRTFDSTLTVDTGDYIGAVIVSSTAGTITITDPMVTVGTAGYEAPMVTAYDITFPSEAGTVYGGSLTVNADGSGTLTSDWAYKRLQGTVTQYPGTGYELMYYLTAWQGQDVHVNGNNTSYDETRRISNMMKSVTNVARNETTRVTRGTFSFAEGTTTAVNRLYGVYPEGVSSASEMSSWLSQNEVYICYQVQTPKTYALTAEEVLATLKGLNNIWSDTGDISITYHADPTLAIDAEVKAIKQSIAPVEDSYTASRTYMQGQFVYIQDTLYKVTSSFSAGTTMTPNVNIRATTVCDELDVLNAYIGNY